MTICEKCGAPIYNPLDKLCPDCEIERLDELEKMKERRRAIIKTSAQNESSRKEKICQ